MRVENRFLELLAKKSRIEKRRISRQIISEETGISLTSIQNWASNQITRFDSQQISAFCRYFDCGVDDLLIIVDEESPEMKTPLAAVAV